MKYSEKLVDKWIRLKLDSKEWEKIINLWKS